MASDDRIARMEAEGILSPAQAALLRASLDAGGARESAGDSAPRLRRMVPWLLLAVFVVLLVAWFLAGGDPEPATLDPQDVSATLNDPGGIGKMNQRISGVIAVALLLVVPLLLWVWLHNSLVAKEESVFEAWAQTESNLERRASLIPALVETVSRYLRHEAETLTAVTDARGGGNLAEALDELLAAQSEATEIVSRGAGTIVESESDLAALYAAQARVGQRMTSFLAVAESYPELRSADQFLELQAQLEGTENRINVARMRFNEAVASYNAAIRKLPASLVAGAGGFRRKAYFEADSEAHEEPELAFD